MASSSLPLADHAREVRYEIGAPARSRRALDAGTERFVDATRAA
ncbi:MAG: hypothetical protein ACREHF_08195 [Rhizomicrobium sp.]